MPLTEAEEGAYQERGWADKVLVQTEKCACKSVAIWGLGGEGQNAQTQDCYVLYHENGTTLAINHWWGGYDESLR